MHGHTNIKYLVLMWRCISDFVEALLPTVSPSKVAARDFFFLVIASVL